MSAQLLELVLTCSSQMRDAVEGLLFEFEITSIEDRSLTDDDCILCFYPPAEIAEALVLRLKELGSHIAKSKLEIALSEKTIVAWDEEWRKNWHPETIRHVTICPAWWPSESVGESEPCVVRITNTQAFGTGTHETTQLMLRLLQYVLGNSSSMRMLDFGSGTGVLSLAAARLGVQEIVAIDCDVQALESCRENALLNGITNIRVAQRKDWCGDEHGFEIVCANILSSVIIEEWRTLRAAAKSKGVILLSGILASELPNFLRQLSLRPRIVLEQREWVALLVDIE